MINLRKDAKILAPMAPSSKVKRGFICPLSFELLDMMLRQHFVVEDGDLVGVSVSDQMDAVLLKYRSDKGPVIGEGADWLISGPTEVK